MRSRLLLFGCLAVGLVLLGGAGVVVAQEPDADEPAVTQAAAGTGFTYQGRLTDSNGNPLDDTCDFRFTLYNAASGGSSLGNVEATGVTVTGGQFTVQLDFGGGAFVGNARWLGIEVQCSGDGGFVQFDQRQQLTPAPYAHFAARAPWGGLTGVPADIADGDHDTTYSAGTGLSLSGTSFSVNTTFTDGRYWRRGGNAGTSAGTDFLGTTDDTALEFKVNGARALRIEPGDSPNLIGGYSGNSVTDGAIGAVIAGGGNAFPTNSVTDNYGTVGGGGGNRAGSADGDVTSGRYATVGGGHDNTASGTRAVVGGGHRNEATGLNSTVGGGHNNLASNSYTTVAGGTSNTAAGFYSVVGGGTNNSAMARFATIGGGGWTDTNNRDTTSNAVYDQYGTVSGGGNNEAGSDNGDTRDHTFASVGGGEGNRASSGWSTVGGGSQNEASRNYATVGGGSSNSANNIYGTVGGGGGNTAGYTAVVGGGLFNKATSEGATVPGGHNNVAGGRYSLAAGRRAQANHSGTFVWADSSNADFSSTRVDQFLIEADGGAGIGTNSPASQLHVAELPSCCADDLDAHVVSVENTATGSWPNVLALKVNIDNPGIQSNFITFWDSDEAVGAIEGDGNGGITLDTTSADFAEYLPKRRVQEDLIPGDIVGVHAGALSKESVGAARVMVVTTSPAVLGNSPAKGDEDLFAPVTFVGQVPVKVRGTVNAGDFIVPSGHDDGTGVAVSLDEITAAQVGQIVGRALESADGAGVTKVNTLVGLPQAQILATLVQQRDARIAGLEAQIERLDEQNSELADRMDALEHAVQEQNRP